MPKTPSLLMNRMMNQKPDFKLKKPGTSIVEWGEEVLKENKEIVVISIGSADSLEQQVPTFVKDSPKKIAILNIDPNLKPGFVMIKELPPLSEKISVDSLPVVLNEKDYLPYYEALQVTTDRFLKADKTVILMYHTDPYGLMSFKKLIEPHLEDLEKKFFVVSSYHSNQPIALFNKDFFETVYNKGASIKQALSAFFTELWGRGKNFSEEEVATIVKEHHFDQYGKFYETLQKLTLNEIIHDVSLKKQLGP